MDIIIALIIGFYLGYFFKGKNIDEPHKQLDYESATQGSQSERRLSTSHTQSKVSFKMPEDSSGGNEQKILNRNRSKALRGAQNANPIHNSNQSDGTTSPDEGLKKGRLLNSVNTSSQFSLKKETESTVFLNSRKTPANKEEKATNESQNYKENILNALLDDTLTARQALAVWDNRKKYHFADDELELLSAYIQKADAITIPRVCGQCRMVGDNCTCDRSWF